MAEALVAGAILSAVFDVLFEKLASQEVVDFFRRKKLDPRLLNKLKRRMNSVIALLDDAEEKQITSTAVKNWLDDLKDAAYQADDFLDEIAYKAYEQPKLEQAPKTCLYQVRIFLSTLHCCKKGMRELETGLKEIFDQLEDLLQQTNTLGLVAQVGVRPPPSQGRVTTSLVDDSSIYGRDADKEAIVNLLLSDDAIGKNLGVVPIVGMGGVGKTTLAQLVYKDSRVKQRFNKRRAWICVSEEFDVLKLTKAIVKEFFKEFGSSDSDSTSLNQLQLKLEQKVRGERVLVVLDDVWNEKYSDWELLLAPLGSAEQGSKVLVTTRNESVASVMSTVPNHHLQELSEDDCWLLFANLAFDGRSPNEYKDLERIGRNIVRKCKGLPLAAKTLGGLLRSRRDAKEWEKILKSNKWDLRSGNIIPALRLSYLYLPPHLKQCFAYCAMFPKDVSFVKKHLVLLWMAEGFIVQSDDKTRETEEIGEEYFEELASRSFFQNSGIEDFEGSVLFVMHDLINDLAKSIAGEFCYNNVNDHPSRQPSERTRHLLYVDGEGLESLSNAEFSRTLLCIWRTTGKPLNSLPRLRRLRVLWIFGNLDDDDDDDDSADLANINDLVRNSKHLRSLQLNNVLMQTIPENMHTFPFLQTLIINNCPLARLPNSIGDMKALRRLDLAGTSLTGLPDSIGNLKNLRHLDLARISIEVLPDSICGLHSLQYLSLRNCEELIELPARMMDLVNLCHLDIEGTHLQCMPPEMGKLIKLQTLSYFTVGKDRGSGIGELGKLPNLQGELFIRNLQNVTDMAWDALEVNFKMCRMEELHYLWEEDDNNTGTHDASVSRNLLEYLQPHVNIKSITVDGYRGTDFPNWVGDSSFSNIMELRLLNCKNCTSLPPLGQLTALQRLIIIGFDSIVSVGAEFYGDSKSIQPFRSLLSLEFYGMPKWQKWTWCHENETQDDEALTAFPVLQNLRIDDCPQFEMALREGSLPNKILRLISNKRLQESFDTSPI